MRSGLPRAFVAATKLINEGRVVAADAVNSPKEFMICKQLIGVEVDPARLADPETDLKTLLAS